MEVVKVLLKNGANVNSRDNLVSPKFFFICTECCIIEFLDVILFYFLCVSVCYKISFNLHIENMPLFSSNICIGLIFNLFEFMYYANSILLCTTPYLSSYYSYLVV